MRQLCGANVDGNLHHTYWQSSGTQPHWVELSGFADGTLTEWSIFHAPHQSYTPKDIRLKLKRGERSEWQDAKSIKLEEPAAETVADDLAEPVVENA